MEAEEPLPQQFIERRRGCLQVSRLELAPAQAGDPFRCSSAGCPAPASHWKRPFDQATSPAA